MKFTFILYGLKFIKMKFIIVLPLISLSSFLLAQDYVKDNSGNRYGTVEVNGKTWITENLNYKMNFSVCYNNNSAYCSKYGQLYTLNEAKGACKTLGIGWRLPTASEWDEFKNYFCQKRRSDYSYTFIYEKCENLLSGGRRNSDGKFLDNGIYGYYWTSSSMTKRSSYIRAMIYREESGSLSDSGYLPENQMSALCIKN